MDNLWILTEERPKNSVISKILNIYSTDFNDQILEQNSIIIKPIFKNNTFMFIYEVLNIKLKNINKVYIKIVSGNSSFLDFLVFKQESEPIESSYKNNILMGIEETKTNDNESRNTSAYQRGSKFIYIKYFYKNIKLYMLYNDELNENINKSPSNSNIFGINMMLTLGIKIVGKDLSYGFSPFKSINEVIDFKNNMKSPPKGNVPVKIKKIRDKIYISGRLSKPGKNSPKYTGNIGYDPNIGLFSLISGCLRKLGWTQRIIITNHEVKQEYINKNISNKFMYICNLLNIELDGIEMPKTIENPKEYWKYESNSEKVTSILLHLVGIYNGLETVYENHAGCERGYFIDKNKKLLTIPKKDSYNNNLYIPDLILYDRCSNLIILIEGKKRSTINQGIKELKQYDSIENEFIKKYYPNSKVYRYLSIFGGDDDNYLNPNVLIYMNSKGKIYLNPNAPKIIEKMFKNCME